MFRRRFLGALAVGSLAALAGCSRPEGSLDLTSVEDDATLTDRYASGVDELPFELATFATDVIEGGPATREGTSPEFDDGRPLEHEGAYYRIDHEVVDTHTETIWVLEVDYDPQRPVEGSTIEYEDLPSVDREALDDAFPPPENVPDNDGPDLGVSHRYPPEADSVFVPDPEYDAVVYEGETYPVGVRRGRDVDVHTYRYTAEQVAASDADLAATVRERYRFSLSGLSEAERSIVEDAIEDDYRIESDADPPEAFESLLERFRAHESIRSDEYTGDWLVRYEGVDYWANVGFPPEFSTPDAGTPPATPPPRSPSG